jgi:guanine nucleotide-binding protein subunit alpha
MRIIHADGFHTIERQQLKAVIYSNMITALHALLWSEETEFGEKAKVHTQLLEKTPADLGPDEAFGDDNVKKAIVGMWLDTGVQKAITKGHKYALCDNLNL